MLIIASTSLGSTLATVSSHSSGVVEGAPIAETGAAFGPLGGLTADPTSFGLVLALLAAMAIIPFLLTLITSFAKFVIVLGIVRQALGTQQVPPTMVITGLALILTIHVMWPTAEQAWANYQAITLARSGSDASPGAPQRPERHLAGARDIGEDDLIDDQVEGDLAEIRATGARSAPSGPISLELVEVAVMAVEPAMRDFLIRHSDPRHAELFRSLRERLRGTAATGADELPDLNAAIAARSPLAAAIVEDLTIHAPAFVLTELTEAFQIGFLIFVPFLVIDLVTSNLLLSMGMHMLSPQTISLPLKLLLFVLVDGWRLLLAGLVGGYA